MNEIRDALIAGEGLNEGEAKNIRKIKKQKKNKGEDDPTKA